MILSIYASIPIVFLIVLLIGLKKPAYLVAPLTLLLTIVLAIVVWKHPIWLIFWAGLEGMIYGLWPIGIIIFGSISLSNLMIKSGAVKQIEQLIGTISSDIRITVVLVAWGLESFLEAIAGFGSGLALPISILTIMGVSPLRAGVVALLANSVPTAYGGVGIGIIALSSISNVPLASIMHYLSWQLFLPSLLMPFLITRVVAGSWKRVQEVFWVPFFAGLGQAIGLMLPLNASLVAVLSGVFNIGGGILATYIFYPHLKNNNTKINVFQAFKTVCPFLIAIFLIMMSGPLVPFIQELLGTIKTELLIYPDSKPLMFRWVSDVGLLLLLAGVIGAIIQGLSFKEISQTIGKTFFQLQKTIIVLVSILAMARIMTYSGMIDSLAQGLSQSVGSFYPIFAPLLGTIGVFVTGSVTSSGILMGPIQAQMEKILDLPTAWLVAMNASGSTAGKMLAPHSVAIVIAAIGIPKIESKITSIIFKILVYYLILLVSISILGSLLL